MVNVQERNERILRGESTEPMHLWIDQYGEKLWAHNRKELIVKHCGKYGMRAPKVLKIYRDKNSGRTVHCGYIVGDRWYGRYAPVEIEA